MSEKSNLSENLITANVRLLWLDPTMDESLEQARRYAVDLHHFVNTIDTFRDVDRCIDFLTDIKYEQVIMIMSHIRSQHILPLIHSITQLYSIYMLSKEDETHETDTTQWYKFKGHFVEITAIYSLIQQDIRDCDRNSIAMSIISPKVATEQNLDELDRLFMYSQLVADALLDIKYESDVIEKFVTLCRNRNYSSTVMIDKLQAEYRHHTPIWWYTYDCFLCPMLNKALRTFEVETIMNMGFFLQDLERHIKELHTEQFLNRPPQSLHLYRGQGVSKSEFEKIRQSQGGLLSFNNFLSTSRDRDVPYMFADSSLQINPTMIGVLFQITVDTGVSSVSFALVDDVSYYKDAEQEVLFSMHTVFRIGRVEKLNNDERLWQVELILTSDNDAQLKSLTERFRLETLGYNEWYRLGRILVIISELDKAEQLFMHLLHSESHDLKKMVVLNQLGIIKVKQGDHASSIYFFEQSLESGQPFFSENHPYLIDFFANAGMAYRYTGNYTKALEYFKKALAISETATNPKLDSVALLYHHLSSLYEDQGQYSTASSYGQQALEIFEKICPPNHPYVAQSYKLVGSLHQKMGFYQKALPYFLRCIEIMEKIGAPNCCDLALSYNAIALVYQEIDDFQNAFSFYGKAIDLIERVTSSDDPHRATCYHNIGVLYSTTGALSKALVYQQKALDIHRHGFSENDPELLLTYSNLGLLYERMGDYTQAFDVYEKALQIGENLEKDHPNMAVVHNNMGTSYIRSKTYEKALEHLQESLRIKQQLYTQDHPSFVKSFTNIGSVLLQMKDYSGALDSLLQGVEMAKRIFSPYHTTLATLYHHISGVYREMGDYTRAIDYLHESLTIDKKTRSLYHPELAMAHAQMASLYFFAKDYSKAISFIEYALEIGQYSLESNPSKLAELRYLEQLFKSVDPSDLLGSMTNFFFLQGETK